MKFKKGYTPWNKGLVGNTNSGSFKNGHVGMSNHQHPLWKGESVSRKGLHNWLHRKLGKASMCEFCGKTKGRFEWANKSHRYIRSLEDWFQLCYSCHDKYDNVHEKMWETRKIQSGAHLLAGIKT